MPNGSTPHPSVSVWSEPVNGLSGRLRVEFEDLQPGLRHAVYLELRNHTIDPIAVTNQPKIHAEMLDAQRKSIGASDIMMSGPSHLPQTAVIPGGAYLGFRVDMQTLGVPTRELGMALVAVGDSSWSLRAGEYIFKAVAVFEKEADDPKNQWVGEIKIPPVEIIITPEMLAANE